MNHHLTFFANPCPDIYQANLLADHPSAPKWVNQRNGQCYETVAEDCPTTNPIRNLFAASLEEVAGDNSVLLAEIEFVVVPERPSSTQVFLGILPKHLSRFRGPRFWRPCIG